MLDKDKLAAVFLTLARCSDALREQDKVELRFVDDRRTDLITLADEARQHCIGAGLLSEPAHSDTPWREAGYLVRDTHGHIVAAMPTESDTSSWEEIKANAARIVACVNACAGVASDDLGDVFRIMKTLLEQLEVCNVMTIYSRRTTRAMLDATRILDGVDKCSK